LIPALLEVHNRRLVDEKITGRAGCDQQTAGNAGNAGQQEQIGKEDVGKVKSQTYATRRLLRLLLIVPAVVAIPPAIGFVYLFWIGYWSTAQFSSVIITVTRQLGS
jgi:hypothetical protein